MGTIAYWIDLAMYVTAFALIIIMIITARNLFSIWLMGENETEGLDIKGIRNRNICIFVACSWFLFLTISVIMVGFDRAEITQDSVKAGETGIMEMVKEAPDLPDKETLRKEAEAKRNKYLQEVEDAKALEKIREDSNRRIQEALERKRERDNEKDDSSK